MKEIMEKHNLSGKTKYGPEKYTMIDLAARHKYLPENLKKYSPEDAASGMKNLLHFSIFRKGYVEITKNPEYISLAAAEKKFNEFMDAIFGDNPNPNSIGKVNILVAPPGFGKTERLKNIKDSVLAFPTNQLKNQVHEERFDSEHLITISLPEIADKALENEVKKLYNQGFYIEAREELEKAANGGSSPYRLSLSERMVIREFLNQSQNFQMGTTEKNMITTHRRAIDQNFNRKYLIFDEDPLSDILPIHSFDVSDIENLKNVLKSIAVKELEKELEEFELFLTNLSPGEVTKPPKFKNLKKVVSDNGSLITEKKIKGNFIEFFKCDFIMRDENNTSDFYYISRKQFPKNKTVLIMSATIPVWIYKKLLGEKFGVLLDLSNVRNCGKVYQNTDHTYSRSSLHHCLKEVSNCVRHLPVITFANFRSRFSNPVMDIYFGNNRGYDDLKGKDCAVVGTFHFNTSKYLLTAAVLGVDLVSQKPNLQNRIVERGGYKFKFMTYENPQLSEIQISLIEGELKQSIGRARILRENAEVFVFSDLPITDKFLSMEQMSEKIKKQLGIMEDEFGLPIFQNELN